MTGNRYVGSTTRFNIRKSQHLYELRHNSHYSKLMQSEYNTFGEDSLTFQLLSVTKNSDNLLDEEQRWLDIIKPTYNLFLKASGCVYVSNNAKEKASKRMKELWKNPTFRDAHSGQRNWSVGHPPNLGKHLSEKTKEKLRQANLGSNNPNYGKIMSQEVRNKIAKSYPGVIDSSGMIYNPIINLSAFCREHHLDRWKTLLLIRGKMVEYKGFRKFNGNNRECEI
jgi:group I intron endonuclease